MPTCTLLPSKGPFSSLVPHGEHVGADAWSRGLVAVIWGILTLVFIFFMKAGKNDHQQSEKYYAKPKEQ